VSAGQTRSWQSADYVGRWSDGDVLAQVLELPRRISVALVVDAGVEVRHVVDVGSGEGPYLAELLNAFPHARGTWLDSSEPMLERAREALAGFGDRVSFVVAPAEKLAASVDTADVIVSSRALHHLKPEALAGTYSQGRALLAPGGWFFNLDHVGSPGDWEQRYRRIREQFTGRRGTPLEPHREDEPLLPAREHVHMLEAAGFRGVDVAWRLLYTALLAART
jgi:SAM-dependent methyltransferase